MFLFAAGLDVPLLGHLSTPMLIAIGVGLWWFWPQLSQAGKQPQAAPPQTPNPTPRAEPLIARVEQLAPSPSVAGEFAALERLLADRDKLHAEVTQALARAKALIDKEQAAAAATKP